MRILFILIMVFVVGQSFAQEAQNDQVELWTSFQLNWKLNRDWRIKFKNQERFNNEESFIDMAYIQGEISRELFKRHRILFRYRYTTEGIEEHDMHRYSLAYVLSAKLFKNLRFSERLMYQYEERVFTRQPFVKLRNKISIEYALNKQNAFEFEYELFLQEKNEWVFDKHRFSLKYTRDLSKQLSFRTAFRYDQVVDTDPQRRTYITELGLRYKL